MSAPQENWRTRFEPLITPLFRFYWRLQRPMTLGAVGLVTDEAGRVLMVRHTYRRGWFLPGGGVEQGETASDAAVRECAEEGGAEATAPPKLIGFYLNQKFRNDHVALYRIDAWRPCPPRENGEIAERAFFAIDALPADTASSARRRIAELFQGGPITPNW